jgi:hypothetical protein
MTVKELKSILEDYDESTPVLVKGENTTYVSSIEDFGIRNVNRYWGENKDYLILMGGDQVGSL